MEQRTPFVIGESGSPSTLIILPVFLPHQPLVTAEDTISEWLDPAWLLRKSHIIESAPHAGAGYQMKITVHFGEGIDNGEDVYCHSRCRSDFRKRI